MRARELILSSRKQFCELRAEDKYKLSDKDKGKCVPSRKNTVAEALSPKGH